MNKAFDMDGYELFAGDFVACGKKLYKINKVNIVKINKVNIGDLELMHVKTTKIVKKKSFEVERLN